MPTAVLVEHTELDRLRERLAEAEEALRAIRAGEVDALIVDGADTPVVYTLKNADNPYRLLVEQMREGALTVSDDGVILYCNAAFAHIVGRRSELLRGTYMRELIADPADMHPANLFPERGTPGRDVRLRTGSGELRNAYISSAPLTIEGENVHCVVVTDLTRQELRRRHDAIVGSSVDAIYSLSLEGAITTWNRAAEQLYGYSAQEILGRNADILSPPEQDGRTILKHARVLEEKLSPHETVRISKSGQLIDVAISVAPLANADGDLEGFSVIARDITERKRAQDHIQFLLREATHRSKNLLAIIQAIAAQTARSAGTIEQFEGRFFQRLQAIALCHDLLVSEDWQRANLADLVRGQLSPFVEPGLRLKLEGPNVFLTSEAAQHIGLALHELATNAMKYGALSVPTGNVNVTWALENDGVDRRLHLRWREYNGPRVTPPSHSGFGSLVIDRLISESLDGAVAIDFRAEGFRWSLDISSDHIVNSPGASYHPSRD
jgi:PAS domain S-box-containing protein